MADWLSTLFSRESPLQMPVSVDWQSALDLPVFALLAPTERDRLTDLGKRLLSEKTITAVAGAQPDSRLIAAMAAQAVLPILHLGHDWYAGWNEIILYPEQFVPEREITDDFGVVHRVRHPLSGEAWEGGPLILSLDDVACSGRCEGYNVVIHEFAHKLDMKNGAADGLPPLHSDMDVEDWSTAFGAAYADFRRRVERFDNGGEEPEIDPYAAESPAEFFAVLTEYFFELPEVLAADYPAVYQQMRRFYRQDPLQRLEQPTHDPATS
jgi:Mlc titration factor MtfA (ptsG expression regulator)